MDSGIVLVIIVVTALAFDFTNGFHDTANVGATSISTQAMSPRSAVTVAALLNFVGAAFAAAGTSAVIAEGVLGKVPIPAVVAPILAFEIPPVPAGDAYYP